MKQGWLQPWRENLKKKLHTIGCSLHQNKLLFRAIFKLIYGTTRSPTTFTGPLVKLCGSNCQDLLQVEFPIIIGPLNNFYLTAEAMDDLSGDQ